MCVIQVSHGPIRNFCAVWCSGHRFCIWGSTELSARGLPQGNNSHDTIALYQPYACITRCVIHSYYPVKYGTPVFSSHSHVMLEHSLLQRSDWVHLAGTRQVTADEDISISVSQLPSLCCYKHTNSFLGHLSKMGNQKFLKKRKKKKGKKNHTLKLLWPQHPRNVEKKPVSASQSFSWNI